MSIITKSTSIEALSENVLATRFANFDQATVENAKKRMIDILGCLIAGANAPGNSALIDLVKTWGGKEEATILIHGGRAPAQNVAMVNSIMARSLDFEVTNVLVEGTKIPSHHGATTVMTAISMGEAKSINGKELITAVLVGDDICARVIAASGFDFTLGWDGTGTVSAFGATAIAGRILGLNQLQMRNSFGILISLLAGSLQSIWDAATTFKLHQGIAARNGIFAAELARTGWAGLRDALLGRFGYYPLYTRGCVNPEILTRDLGKKYYAETSFKRYPCCLQNYPGIECALALVHKQNISVEEIEEVTVRMPRRFLDSYLGQPFRVGDFPHANAIFSYPYAVATALLRRGVRPEHFSEESIRDPQVNALMAKTKLTELPGKDTYAAELKVRMVDGREFSESTDAPKDDPITDPMTKEEIIAKFRANVDFSRTVTKGNAEELLNLLENLEDVDGVNKLVRLLVA